MTGPLSAAWSEGYVTALVDFGITPTDETMAKATPNPYGSRNGRRQLSDYERHEIRHALGYHFEDCPGDWDTQAEILQTITERILSRRPERSA